MATTEERSPEFVQQLENAEVDLTAETLDLTNVVPAQAGVVASGPVDEVTGKTEPTGTVEPPPTSKAPLFDTPTFDPDKACHEIFRKTETVRAARASYEAAKEEASDKKKVLDTRAKELEDLIKELQWKQQRAEQAVREPKLVPAEDATDGVEGMGELQASGDDDPLDEPEPDDDEGSEGEERQDELGSLADA